MRETGRDSGNLPHDSGRGWAMLSRPFVYRSLFVLALLIVAQHLIAHAGLPLLPFSMGWQDIVIGYPAAGVVAILALVVWGKDPTPH